MAVETAIYSDADGAFVIAIVDGVTMHVPIKGDGFIQNQIKAWVDAGNIIAQYVPPSPTTSDVDAERDRRIALGFMFNSVKYQSRPDDISNINGAGSLAIAAVMGGAQAGNLRWSDPSNDFVWIADDNSTVPMDAQTVIAFGQAAAGWKSAHIFAARALKDASPIPADYAADSHWPARA